MKKEKRLNSMKQIFTRGGEALKGFFSNKKRVFEIILALLLIILGLSLYFSLSKREMRPSVEQFDYKIKELNDGINAYRLEQYDKAEVLFLKVIEVSKQKKIKSLATLYLGNVYYRLNNFNTAFSYYQTSISLNKKNIHALYNAALSSLKKGDTDRALKYSLKAYKMDPEYAPNLLLLGNIYYGMGSYNDALLIYGEIDDTDTVARFNRACTYIHMNETNKAESLLEALINDSGVQGSLKGLCYLKLGQLTQDPDDLGNAIEYFPSSPVLRYNLALRLLPQGNYSEIVSLLRAIDREMRNRDFEVLFGRILFKGGYYKEALDFYTDLYERNGSPELAQFMGDIHLKLSNKEMAINFYTQAIEETYNENVFINLFNLYLEAGDNERAIELCHNAIKFYNEDSLPYICLAEVYFQLEDRSSAGEYLDKAVHNSEDSVKDLMRVAAVYQKNGLYNNALQFYHKILSIDPSYSIAHGGIAEVYFYTGHQDKVKRTLDNLLPTIQNEELYYRLSLLKALVYSDDVSLRIYEGLIQDFPYRYEAYFNMSCLLIKKEEYEKASQTVKLCLNRIKPMDTWTLSNIYSLLGVSLMRSGRVHEAVDFFNKALELDRSNEIPLLNMRLISDLSIKDESRYF